VHRCIRWTSLVASIFIAACGGGGGGGGGNLGDGSSDNVVPIAVNGGLNGNVNQPFVSLQVCVPNTSQCQTINNVLVDTGSVGLRLIPSALGSLASSLPLQTANGESIGECIEFVDDSHAWGQLSIADIKIGSKTAEDVPIQLVTNASSIGAAPATCGSGNPNDNLDTTAELGGNGIIGIGHFQQDCGLICEMFAVEVYYRCSSSGGGSSCIDTTLPAAWQLQNPIAKFSSDNNGSLIELPAVGDNGAASVTGSLIFGINTRSNNQLGSANPQYLQIINGYYVNYISTTYKGVTYQNSFIDSGSNGLYFPDNTLQRCASPLNDFYCQTYTGQATIFGRAPSISRAANFSLADLNSLNGNFSAFKNIGGFYSGGFDWGLPFFYGRKVYTAIEGQPNISAPYVAF
jgi:hypothetical protein